ncbi:MULTISPECIES: hypothetical protein [Burkholderia]|uniref:hypothetical protein n=1 Tax=Burkholderia TaxID=32008 RepID=UPI000AB33009|nr:MULTISPECIES: hypothetical protein [Burkholderia]MCA7893134.1 hypothetical protein [Burkholderia cepacia]
MEIIDARTVDGTFEVLHHGVKLNHHVDKLLRTMERELSDSAFTSKGVSAVATFENSTIDIRTPHGKIIGIVEHVRTDGKLAAQATFFAVRVLADGKTTASRITSLNFDGGGFITAINKSAVTDRPRLTDDDIIYEICHIVLTALQDKLTTVNTEDFFA